ncbi:MAG: DNA recombination protein RmuC, partial [Candidatus Zixiibacteriota bacterium]
MTITIIAFIGGAIFGAAIVLILRSRQNSDSRRIAEELLRDSDVRRQQELERVIEHLKLSFGNLSTEALSKANDEFYKVRKTLMESDREVHVKDLDSKKGLIDESLKSVKGEIDKVQQLMVSLEKDRATKYGELDSSLKSHQAQVQQLMQTANSLREALASTKARGQWGERMAEDVLRLAGFIENVNYYKQRTMNEGKSRPDFSFPLPQGLMLNMDVKFPLDNYLRYLEAKSETDENQYRSDFLRDVRKHVKDVCGRDYINPSEKTVDYMLLFIPNEQVYAFIHESDRALLDEAMKNKVI